MASASSTDNLLPADVVVTYSAEGGTPAHNKIVLEMDDRYDPDRLIYGVVRIRHYPSGLTALSGVGATPITRGVAGVTYRSIKGTYEWTNEYRTQEVSGVLEFNGSDKVGLRYPLESWAGDTVFVKASRFYDMEGNSYGEDPRLNFAVEPLGGYPSVRLNIATQELIAKVPCFGTVEYRYTTTYRILRYQPTLYTTYGYKSVPFWNADSYGKFEAVETSPTGEKYTTTLQVQGVDAPAHDVELYRIEYTVLVNDEGTWETPINFPTNYQYPGTSPAQEFDVNKPYMKVTRLLEIAYFGLSDPTTRASANAKSSTLTPVPTNFSALERAKGVLGVLNFVGDNVASVDRYAQHGADYYKDIRNFPPAKTRVDTFAFKLSRPYDGTSGDNAPAGLQNENWGKWRFQRTGPDTGIWVESSNAFKITMTIIPGKIPLEVPAPSRNDLTSGAMTAEEYQILHTNNTVARAWAAIDWLAIWESIQRRYPNTVFNYTIDAIQPLINKSNARPSI